MKLNEVIGRSIKEIWVRTKIDSGGLDEAEVCIELDDLKTIGFPWDFNTDIEKAIHKGAVKALREPRLRNVKNAVITDVLILKEENGETGFYELENGLIIYQSTMFFSGVEGVGLQVYNSIKEFEMNEESYYLRLSKDI